MSAQRIAEWLSRTNAIRADAVSVAALAPFLMERLRTLACADCDAYLAILDRSVDERSRVVAACAPSESWLFRYPASFEFLRRSFRNEAREIRMLSAGSGGVSEPASMMATLVGAGLAPERTRIDAIDQSVEAARAPNVFTRTQLREPIPSWAAGSFRSIDAPAEGVALHEPLFTRIVLKQGDLRSCPLESHYDAIFFRNVAIYLPDAARMAILSRLKLALTAGGMLFVGHAEMRVAEQAGFVPVAEVGAFALRPRVSSGAPVRVAHKPVVRTPEIAVPAACVAAPRPESMTSLEIARAAVARDPSCAALHETLAAEELAVGDVAAAEGSFRRALYLEQNRESVLLSLALLLEQQGRSAESARFRSRALKAHLASEGGAR